MARWTTASSACRRSALAGLGLLLCACGSPTPAPGGDGQGFGGLDIGQGGGGGGAETSQGAETGDIGGAGEADGDVSAAVDTGDGGAGGADTSGGGSDAGSGGDAVADGAADTAGPDSAGSEDTGFDTKPVGPVCGKPSDCTPHKDTPHCNILDGECVACVVDTHCKAGMQCQSGTCVDISCKPGSTTCSNNFLATCKATGAGWTLSNCPDAAPYCITGSCALCVPDEVFCAPPAAGKTESKTVLKCNGSGTDADFVLTCGGSTICQEGKCQICTAGLKMCEGGKAMACNPEGTGWDVSNDCAAKDLACLGGLCVDPCGSDVKSNTNVGCDYWAVDLDNAQVPCGPKLCDAHNQQYAVILSNTRPKAAEVTVTTSTGKQSKYVVPPNGLQVLNLPDPAWGLPAPIQVDGTGIGPNAYRIKANVPIVAYQFNPLSNVGVFSNDASLLLPSNGLGTDYFVMSRQQNFNNLRGSMTVVATAEGTTEVDFIASCKTLPGKGIPGLAKGQTMKFSLQQGEVLNIETNELGADLTGSRVKASKPVAVFGGSEGSNVPDTNLCVIAPGANQGNCKNQNWPCTSNADCPVTCCADHLEEQLFPISQWGTTYLATKLQPRGAEKDVWRVVASQDNTVMSTDPPQSVLPKLNAGEWFEFESGGDFVLVANKPVMLGQFMASANAPDPANDTCSAKFSGSKVCEHHFTSLGDPIMCMKNADCPNIKQPDDAKTGDPAFIMTVGADRYLTKYVFLVPDKYKQSFVNIMGPKSASVLIDGQPVPPSSYSIFGSGQWKAARIAIGPGQHVLDSSEAVGVIVYGYDQYVSYGFPGGTAL